MRNRKVTGTSKRAAVEMMCDAIDSAVASLGPTRVSTAQLYKRQLRESYLTQDQIIAIESLIDMAFSGGIQAQKLGLEDK